MVRHSESTPPTSAASMSPVAIARRAEAKALALDEQADEITTAGPESRSARRTNAASEKLL